MGESPDRVPFPRPDDSAYLLVPAGALLQLARAARKDPERQFAIDDKTAKMVDIRLNGDDFVTWIVDYLFSNEPSATVDAPYAIEMASRRWFRIST